MKKFIISVSTIVLALFFWNVAYYRLGIYVDIHPDQPVETFTYTEGKEIFIEKDGKKVPFEIRGVDMGVGIPGHWATDFAISEKTYLRWFEQIQDMGANTIRVYTILSDEFYNAFYEYNKDREEPLYLLHGLWINDYIFNSHADAYDKELFDTLIEDSRTLIDILHGKKTLSLGYEGVGNGTYRKDVSPWVLGYIVGVEWESGLVTYTNQKSADKTSFKGEYLYTTDQARPFEVFLAEMGNKMIEYESQRYKEQRLLAFSNWPTTDPFVYPLLVSNYRNKFACVDVEHIKQTDQYQSGMFASYHIYSYFPDFLEIVRATEDLTDKEIEKVMGTANKRNMDLRLSRLNAPSILDYLENENMYDSKGRLNTYYSYLYAINKYHTIPVVISEYGITSGRGMAQRDVNTGRNQGNMTEEDQGNALVECYQDIMDAGCAGSCLFSWQDEWFKRTWNTMNLVTMDKRPYWSDFQTNEQFFGILTFDPGKKKSVCYVDGDITEWKKEDLVVQEGDMELSMKYDEKFLYFLVKKEQFDPEKDVIYLPIDTTPKTGSSYCENHDLRFERNSDFLLVLKGKEESRLLVQKRYEALLSTFSEEYYNYNAYLGEFTPDKHTPVFETIQLPLTLVDYLPSENQNEVTGETYETGLLRYGNGNPESSQFDSIADFIISGDYVEIRLPWSLLNFCNPSEMMIHDDYFECYGVEELEIDKMYVGLGTEENKETRIPMEEFPLKGWEKKVTSHERLKKSYYIMKDYWTSLDKAAGKK